MSALDVLEGLDLVRRRRVLEGVLELALPLSVGRVGEAGRQPPLRVELQQLVGHVDEPRLDTRLGLLPRLPAHAVESRGAAPGAVVLLEQVEPGERDVELGPIRVLDHHQVFLPRPLLDLGHAQVTADAVLGVDHEVAGLEVFEVGEKRRRRRLALLGLGDQLRGGEDVFGAVDQRPGVEKRHAVADVRLGDDRADDRSAQRRAFLQVGAQLAAVADADLVRDAVLVENVGEALDVADRRRRHQRLRPFGQPRLQLLHGVRDSALKARDLLRAQLRRALLALFDGEPERINEDLAAARRRIAKLLEGPVVAIGRRGGLGCGGSFGELLPELIRLLLDGRRIAPDDDRAISQVQQR